MKGQKNTKSQLAQKALLKGVIAHGANDTSRHSEGVRKHHVSKLKLGLWVKLQDKISRDASI